MRKAYPIVWPEGKNRSAGVRCLPHRSDAAESEDFRYSAQVDGDSVPVYDQGRK